MRTFRAKIKLYIPANYGRAAMRFQAILLCLCVLGTLVRVQAQTEGPGDVSAAGGHSLEVSLGSTLFRVEKVSIPAGAELITILARRPVVDGPMQGPGIDTPLISVLRDTLGDDIPENDRLRYVWMHSYTKPSLGQKIAAAVPFFYSRTSDRKVGNGPPPTVMDIQQSNKAVWNKLFWYLFKRAVVSDLSLGAKASTLQYRQNTVDHRKAAIADILAALTLFQEVEGEKLLSNAELEDIYARLSLDDKTFGWKMQSQNLGRVYEEERKKTRDLRNHNWELLRQFAEEQGLYFEPLVMDDGFPRHAVLWTTESDIKANKGKRFEKRFLNIKNPWTDSRLAKWDGYKEDRWFDADDRQVDADTPGATRRTMIPLALYGLDYPKIPVILIDFRDKRNPKFREVSRRLLVDVADNMLSLSRFSSVPYFVGRFVYDFVTARRGMDLNQASRFRSYSHLKLLLALDESMKPGFRQEVTSHMRRAGINPLENGIDAETRIAAKQYENLLAYAKKPDGLSKKIDNDRREEMGRIKHSGTVRAFTTMASVFTLGLYTHREKETPQLFAQMDQRRRLDYHERFVRQVAFASAGPEIDTNTEQLRRSLHFIAQSGADAEEKTTRALAKIFAVSVSEDTRMLCLAGLYKVNNTHAKNQLLAIYNALPADEKWRTVSGRYLKLALEEGQRISAADISSIEKISVAAAEAN